MRTGALGATGVRCLREWVSTTADLTYVHAAVSSCSVLE